jgi:hypothetical protein
MVALRESVSEELEHGYGKTALSDPLGDEVKK